MYNYKNIEPNEIDPKQNKTLMDTFKLNFRSKGKKLFATGIPGHYVK